MRPDGTGQCACTRSRYRSCDAAGGSSPERLQCWSDRSEDVPSPGPRSEPNRHRYGPGNRSGSAEREDSAVGGVPAWYHWQIPAPKMTMERPPESRALLANSRATRITASAGTEVICSCHAGVFWNVPVLVVLSPGTGQALTAHTVLCQHDVEDGGDFVAFNVSYGHAAGNEIVADPSGYRRSVILIPNRCGSCPEAGRESTESAYDPANPGSTCPGLPERNDPWCR